VQAVLDPNVIISALLSPNGSPARVVQAWLDGGYELVVSPLLLGELDRALDHPKLTSTTTRPARRPSFSGSRRRRGRVRPSAAVPHRA